MKILFSWTGVTSYMADCWRALQSEPDVELKVIVETAESGREFEASKTLQGLDYVLVDRAKAADFQPASCGFRPDALFVGGWRSVTTRRVLAAHPDVPKVFCLDMPWRWSLRCFLARFLLHGFLGQFDAVFVPGASSARYARWLGFEERCIWRKLYAVDQRRLQAPCEGASRKGRKGFLFVGRYSPEKRVDLIERAERRYRALGGTWPVDYYGQGGKFVQADGMPQVYAEHACLLLASSFDPWPLVMLEARSVGLSVIASDRCGNGAELGAFVVPYGDVEAMARTMLAVEKGERRSRPDDLSDYDCNAWAVRVQLLAEEVKR